MTPAPSKNFRLLLLSGGGYFMAMQAGNPNFVLPWISTHLGASAILVVLIVPMVQVGRVVAELLMGPKLNALSFRKGVHTASLLGLAVSMLLAAFAAGVLPPGTLRIIATITQGQLLRRERRFSTRSARAAPDLADATAWRASAAKN